MHYMYLPGLFFYLAGVITLTGVNVNPVMANELNCMMCHKHRGLSRIDEKGEFRLFYINNELFDSGPHRRNKCSDCHKDIDRIPHEPAKKVDCTQQCHVIEPSGKKKFSHKNIAKTLASSVHGKLDDEGKEKPHQSDFPGCKDCHDQPLYRPISVFKGVAKHGVSARSISRCKSCHTSGNFAEDFYEHVTSRLHKTRFSKEIIEVCAKCHQDSEFRKRHDLDDVITSYKQTFHGKMVELGSERTPDCLDCHVVEGENNHLIEAKTVATSSTHPSNVGNTCRASDCHKNASAELASFQTHVTYDREKYPLQFYMLVGFKALMAIVLYFFLTLIFLELLRRLFPRFAFFKDNQPHHKNTRPKDQ
ncbi:MAG: cytochrome C [Gammaproteobacteria bacterium]|nr:cytochrome C [Gammaproteobacteria bacterium]